MWLGTRVDTYWLTRPTSRDSRLLGVSASLVVGVILRVSRADAKHNGVKQNSGCLQEPMD
jgi:hypothetical protein